jgi:Putative prokaryotic signal transducing protein
MKKLTSSDSLITIRHYRNILDSEGIACEIRNEFLGSIAGEIPYVETWPELWVLRDLDFDRAKQLLDAAITDESPQAAWTCRTCDEVNEGQFAACWNCGTAL